MRRKFLKGVLATVVVAVLAGYGISRSVNNSDAELSKLTLANIEALADGETFYFNGQFWTTEERWYNTTGGEWMPELRKCSVTSAAHSHTFTVGFPKYGLGYEYQYQGGTSTSEGKEVICVQGNGNCWNGVDCKRA